MVGQMDGMGDFQPGDMKPGSIEPPQGDRGRRNF